MARLHLDHVSKYYRRKKYIFDDLDLVINQKEFVALLGPSECGKSTLLRMIAGIEKTTGGVICIGDHVVDKKTPAGGEVAMVFQNHALYPRMTIRENIAYSLKLQRWPEDKIQQSVDHAAALLGVTEILDQKPSGITAEQRQMVAIARAIARNPKLLLLDEPFLALDSASRYRMRQTLQAIYHQMDTVFLYATHDPAEAMAMGTQIMILGDGRIQQMAAPQDIYARPRSVSVAGLIGVPAMNIWRAKVCRQAEQAREDPEGVCLQIQALGEYALSRSLAAELSDQGYIDREVFVGVRPEQIHLQPEGSLHAVSSFYSIDGAAGYLYLESSDKQVTIRVRRGEEPGLGEPFCFSMDESDIHLFDIETQKRIGERTSAASSQEPGQADCI